MKKRALFIVVCAVSAAFLFLASFTGCATGNKEIVERLKRIEKIFADEDAAGNEVGFVRNDQASFEEFKADEALRKLEEDLSFADFKAKQKLPENLRTDFQVRVLRGKYGTEISIEGGDDYITIFPDRTVWGTIQIGMEFEEGLPEVLQGDGGEIEAFTFELGDWVMDIESPADQIFIKPIENTDAVDLTIQFPLDGRISPDAYPGVDDGVPLTLAIKTQEAEKLFTFKGDEARAFLFAWFAIMYDLLGTL